jgi:hypothetical protein
MRFSFLLGSLLNPKNGTDICFFSKFSIRTCLKCKCIVDTFHAVRVADPENLPDGKISSSETSISTYEIKCYRNQKKKYFDVEATCTSETSANFLFAIYFTTLSVCLCILYCVENYDE